MILCQTKGGMGCSACCGLFNWRDISRESLASYLQEGRERVSAGASIDEDYICLHQQDSIRDLTSHVCPFQGFISPCRPGCLLHPAINQKDGRGISLYGARICDSFLCPAHQILSDREQDFLVSLVRDWYHYTLAIIDPLTFRWMISEAEERGLRLPASLELFLSRAYVLFAEHLQTYPGPLFFYTRREYMEAKDSFSLSSPSGRMDPLRREILKMLG